MSFFNCFSSPQQNIEALRDELRATQQKLSDANATIDRLREALGPNHLLTINLPRKPYGPFG